ncbi:hypothetical protein FNJ84_16875 [Paracoccus sp. M683]|uniref:hypothetical protein n=1 Tax=Paracoccus sp. M683 TaxID=2594268 RepID=UPI00117EE012|nr:hypothetical protein [Paracoccus sp. M683]TRW95174.1 hypothetical protein FNJ84_16875 [Paracoccus sp. M683]
MTYDMIRLASNAQLDDKRGTLYWIVLRVNDLETRLQQDISRYEKAYSKYYDLLTCAAQKALEYRALVAFQDRLHNTPRGKAPIEIGAGELPLSFNEDKFAGNFLWLECLVCGASSRPSQTIIRPFSDDEGMQYYGQLRCCPCGQPIAYKTEGYRRP